MKPRSHRCRCTRRAVSMGTLTWCRISKQLLDLEFLAPDSSRLIPVYFSEVDRAIRQSHPRNALAFTPAPASVDASQSSDLADSRPCGEGLDIGNLAQNLASHDRI